MAYQIQRKNRIVESLDLLDNDGKVAHTLRVNVEVDKIAAKVNRAKSALAQAQKRYKEAPGDDETYTAFGNAIVFLFAAIFGDEQTKTIVDFYEGAYTEMLVDILPFIGEVIIPKIREASEARRKQMLKAASVKW